MKNQLDRYDYLVDIEKIIDVYQTIKRNSKHKDKLVLFELFFSCNVFSIYETLKNKKYHHQKYHIFLLKGPKYRVIMSEVMSDKIVNHLISKYILFPVIEPKLIPMNVATREGKGTKMGLFYVKKYINHLKYHYDKFYVLKCDVFKYFYSIDHDLLIKKLESIVLDEDLFSLLREIICSTDRVYVNEEIDRVISMEIQRLKKMNIHDLEYKIDELQRIPRYRCGKGLPIGNMTSQILAVYYLNDLDHFIKEKLKIRYYVRYMDDFVLFHPDKDYLKYCLREIEKKLTELKLRLNDKTQIVEMQHGFCFLGYKFRLRDKKLLILIRGKTKQRIRRKLAYLEKNNPSNKQEVLASYRGYLKNAHSGGFCYKNHLK